MRLTLQQHFYSTTAPTPGSPTGTLACSSEIETVGRSLLESHSVRYGVIPGVLPIACRQFGLGQGRVVLSRTVDGGLDSFGRRGRSFTHNVVLAAAGHKAINSNGFLLFNRADAFDESCPYPGPEAPDVAIDIDPKDAWSHVPALHECGDPARLADLLDAAVLSVKRQRPLVIVPPSWDRANDFMEALLLCLPHALRAEVTFSTFDPQPDSAQYHWIMTPDSGLTWSEDQVRYQFYVFNFARGVFSSPGPELRYGKLLANSIDRGNERVLELILRRAMPLPMQDPVGELNDLCRELIPEPAPQPVAVAAAAAPQASPSPPPAVEAPATQQGIPALSVPLLQNLDEDEVHRDLLSLVDSMALTETGREAFRIRFDHYLDETLRLGSRNGLLGYAGTTLAMFSHVADPGLRGYFCDALARLAEAILTGTRDLPSMVAVLSPVADLPVETRAVFLHQLYDRCMLGLDKLLLQSARGPFDMAAFGTQMAILTALGNAHTRDVDVLPRPDEELDRLLRMYVNQAWLSSCWTMLRPVAVAIIEKNPNVKRRLEHYETLCDSLARAEMWTFLQDIVATQWLPAAAEAGVDVEDTLEATGYWEALQESHDPSTLPALFAARFKNPEALRRLAARATQMVPMPVLEAFLAENPTFRSLFAGAAALPAAAASTLPRPVQDALLKAWEQDYLTFSNLVVEQFASLSQDSTARAELESAFLETVEKLSERRIAYDLLERLWAGSGSPEVAHRILESPEFLQQSPEAQRKILSDMQGRIPGDPLVGAAVALFREYDGLEERTRKRAAQPQASDFEAFRQTREVVPPAFLELYVDRVKYVLRRCLDLPLRDVIGLEETFWTDRAPSVHRLFLTEYMSSVDWYNLALDALADVCAHFIRQEAERARNFYDVIGQRMKQFTPKTIQALKAATSDRMHDVDPARWNEWVTFLRLELERRVPRRR